MVVIKSIYNLPLMADQIILDDCSIRRLAAAALLQAVYDTQRGPEEDRDAAADWLQDQGSHWAAALGLEMPPLARMRIPARFSARGWGKVEDDAPREKRPRGRPRKF